MSVSTAAGGLCRQCRAHRPVLSQMRAPLRYEEPTRTLIHRFKFEGYFALGRPLAGFLIDGWPGWNIPPDLILPIPLHPRRRRQRGYNQAELLARPLGEAMAISIDVSALRRTRHTVPQVGLGPDERHTNVQGAFAAEAGVVGGRHILLIDDVLTTGATMRAAAEALLAAGAADVAAYCLARVS
ncbi:MAG: ComF family protein [Candidatus Promineofilum sp.]|nr:ComF family protein [Promineifilum sp.]